MSVSQEQVKAYTRAMNALDQAEIPYLLAGAAATHHYTDVWRNTKDLDLFLRPEHRDSALQALDAAGFQVEVTSPGWLAKAHWGEILVDLITGFGNLLMPIDDSWFAAAEPATVLGREGHVISATDLIWMKAYVAGRERFDAADIAHVIRRAPDHIDWQRLIERFDTHWDLLLLHLLYFRFVYPMARDLVPAWVLEHLTKRLADDIHSPQHPEVLFRGPLLDRYSYIPDIEIWGEIDPREALAQIRGLSVDQVRSERDEDREKLASSTS